jgi:hypothetical protein
MKFKEWFHMMEIGGQGTTAVADPAPQPSTVAMATGGGKRELLLSRMDGWSKFGPHSTDTMSGKWLQRE